MALTATTLSSDITASQLKFAVASTTGFAAGQPILIDGEYMYCVSVPVSGTITVRGRGSEGTVASAHDTLSPVATSATFSDFPAVPDGGVSIRPPYVDDIVAVGENGTVPAVDKDTTFLLTKATALSSTTLAAPTKAQNGLKLTFTSQTAAAHVITATSLWGDGVSGSPHTTATWAAYIGASLTVVADNGIWNVVSAVGVTIT